MFSKVLKKANLLSNFNKYYYSSGGAGNLYTWGLNTTGLGYQLPTTASKIRNPNLVSQFNGNVVKVAMGPHHTAVVTNDGELYTFGLDISGNLGHNSSSGLIFNPTLVAFFKKNNLKVTDVACGYDHTIALTDEGDVYTWGNGGYGGFLRNLLMPPVGPLGHGNNSHRLVPTPVEYFRGHTRIQSVTSGLDFCFALNGESDLYNWGKGHFGVFGTGHFGDLKVPALNETIKEMREHDGLKVQKIKSCQYYTLALFDDGSLWGWGNNNQGQIGCGHQIGIEMRDINHDHPAKVEKLEGKKVVDFDVADDIAVVLTDDNKVYYMGLRLIWEPIPFPLPNNKKVKKIAAAHSSVAVVTDENEIFMKNEFIESGKEDYKTGLMYVSNSAFNGGEILDIGGGYENKFAIVKN